MLGTQLTVYKTMRPLTGEYGKPNGAKFNRNIAITINISDHIQQPILI